MNKDFDPLAYIENAFLDREPEVKTPKKPAELDVQIPEIGEYIRNGSANSKNGKSNVAVVEPAPAEKKGIKFKKTTMSAPRPRRSRKEEQKSPIDGRLEESLGALPKMIQILGNYYDDVVTSNYYRGEFKESRNDLIRRLLDPELSLEETSRLLGVCPATVRRYTNRKWLTHHRTKGGQRRFRLGDIVRFVESHGRFPEA